MSSSPQSFRVRRPSRSAPPRALPTAATPTTRALALLLREDAEAADVTPENAAEIVEAELVDDAVVQPAFDDLTVDRVLDAFLDEKTKKLVPARTAEFTDLGDGTAEERARRLNRARMLDDLRASAWADATLISYGGHVRAWRDWCKAEGVSALPFHAERVADHLLDYAFVWDDEGEVVRDADGGPMPAVSAGTIGLRVAALNKAAEFIGLPRPGDNAGIQELVRGIRRRLRVAPAYRKAALDLDRVNACLSAANGARYTATRNRAAVLTRARTGATAGQLARLGWPDVTLEPEQVTLVLAPAHRHGQPTVVVLPAHRNPDLCLVHALRELRTMSVKLDRVFSHPALRTSRRPKKGEPARTPSRSIGDAMTRQALHQAVHSAAATAGGWDALPTLPDRLLARLLAAECPMTPLVAARDRALLLAGFYTAARRSNLSALNWGDVTDYGEDGCTVIWRRSKTDQEGRGRVKWLPEAGPDSDKACPATALRAWKAQLSAALGRQPRNDEPVFVALTGAGTLKVDEDGQPVRLSGESINDVVQKLAIAAGLMRKPQPGERATYGAHSLRSGFVTEGLRNDKLSIAEVQEVTDHKSVNVLMDYRREVNAPKNNAARKLLLGKNS
ncbi:MULTISPECIES: tyrosine-type recombinase/integrase [unclassified Modestobacter]|uniref:tyrosine-type recombinase/integrase n=1 Tax=unclassified Modestobacter TaxID=2643866 RepID=UPI0022AA23CE|nr:MULTISPECIES: tyrosine-type recombinase/integrase [unclassified Modestobacter]MCZ2826005.1 tyrosine-type recombinase/integrase [Modestobacter sp. VKM Ac-2981]MCZ2852930.1 tyrosine-type recombinase/integrase [Modestobacter sp. VKM Ac-2982]